MFDPGLGGAQVHDFNPGVRQNGLFWTTTISDTCVDVDLDAGTATYAIDDLAQWDHFDFQNAILGDGNQPRMGRVSFKVQWTGGPTIEHFDNPAQQFRGDFRIATAQMEWSGRSGEFEFQSLPLDQSTTDAAQIGFESNGSYYS